MLRSQVACSTPIEFGDVGVGVANGLRINTSKENQEFLNARRGETSFWGDDVRCRSLPIPAPCVPSSFASASYCSRSVVANGSDRKHNAFNDLHHAAQHISPPAPFLYIASQLLKVFRNADV